MNSNNHIPGDLLCDFCEEAVTKRLSGKYRARYEVEKRILLEDANNMAIPTISPLSCGHVLIVPKHHITSILQIEIGLLADFLKFADFVESLVRKNFGPTVVFEHGVGQGKGGGCGISHAHMHILPLAMNEARKVQIAISKNYRLSDPFDIRHVFEWIDKKRTYLLFGFTLKEIKVAYSDVVVCQYLRKVISEILKKQQWDWNALYGVKDFLSTFKILSGSLKKATVQLVQ